MLSQNQTLAKAKVATESQSSHPMLFQPLTCVLHQIFMGTTIMSKAYVEIAAPSKRTRNASYDSCPAIALFVTAKSNVRTDGGAAEDLTHLLILLWSRVFKIYFF